MKVVCHSCNTDFETNNKKFKCPSCGHGYNIKDLPDIYNVKLINGVLVKELSYDEIKNGIKTGRFLKMDYISGENVPWMKIQDSFMSDFIPRSSFSGGNNTSSGNKSWVVLFIFSFLVNIILLFFLYMQKVKIDDLING